jgi:mannose-6-phosphate isomerase
MDSEPITIIDLKTTNQSGGADMSSPLTFRPILMERIWGGRRLGSHFAKKLPPDKRIGESWEIVDREEAQSVVAAGPLAGKTLHDLWTERRTEVFGEVADSPRFPLLIKLLDAEEKLSLQVHPPADIAARLGSEPKTECWYVARAEHHAELYVGLRRKISPTDFRKALEAGQAADHLHAIRVKAGDVMFLPSGRFHAIGGGNLLVEVQQNSDTTYRVFDWNRVDDSGKPRLLHIEQAMASIDFDDVQPQLAEPNGEILVRHELFELQRWELNAPREIIAAGQFAIVCCLTGKIGCTNVEIEPGEFMLIPAAMTNRVVRSLKNDTTMLRITIPRPGD